jgi:hypothetical protein
MTSKALLNSLTEQEIVLLLETANEALVALDEDALVELHQRIRRATRKCVKQYRGRRSTCRCRPLRIAPQPTPVSPTCRPTRSRTRGVAAADMGEPQTHDPRDEAAAPAAIGLVLLIAPANSVALVLLIDQLVSGNTSQGKLLFLSAGQVWITNMIVFGLVFWELDRGSPVSRTDPTR